LLDGWEIKKTKKIIEREKEEKNLQKKEISLKELSNQKREEPDKNKLKKALEEAKKK